MSMYLALADSSLWGEPLVKCKMFPIGQPLNFWSLSTRVFSAPHSTDRHALGSFHAGIWWLDQTTDQIIVVPCHRSSYIHWALVTSCSFALIYQILCFLWPWSRWNFVFIPTFVNSYSFLAIASIFILSLSLRMNSTLSTSWTSSLYGKFILPILFRKSGWQKKNHCWKRN